MAPPYNTPSPSSIERGETPEMLPADNEEEPDWSQQQQQSRKSGLGTGSVMAGFASCYTLMIAVSVIIEHMHVQLNRLLLMVACVVVFAIFSLAEMVLMDSQLHRTAMGGYWLPSAESRQ